MKAIVRDVILICLISYTQCYLPTYQLVLMSGYLLLYCFYFQLVSRFRVFSALNKGALTKSISKIFLFLTVLFSHSDKLFRRSGLWEFTLAYFANRHTKVSTSCLLRCSNATAQSFCVTSVIKTLAYLQTVGFSPTFPRLTVRKLALSVHTIYHHWFWPYSWLPQQGLLRYRVVLFHGIQGSKATPQPVY